MKRLKYFLGFLWCLPVSVLFWIIGIVLKFCKQIEKFEIRKDFTFLWDLDNKGWVYTKLFMNRGFIGQSWGNNIIVCDSDKRVARWARTVMHETDHCYWQYILGIFFPVIYFMNSVFIFLFLWNKHSYLDNYFEKSARKYAGQKVNIDKSQWPDKNDRWAWW